MNKIYKIKKGSKGAVVCSELAKNKGAVVVLTAIASLFTPSSFAAYEGSAIDTLNKTLVLNGDLTIDRVRNSIIGVNKQDDKGSVAETYHSLVLGEQLVVNGKDESKPNYTGAAPEKKHVYSSIISGDNNTINDRTYSSVIAGSDLETRNIVSSGIFGGNHVVHDQSGVLISGVSNTVIVPDDLVEAGAPRVNGSTVSGLSNTLISSIGSDVSGIRNTLTYRSHYNIAGGHDNTLSAESSLMVGAQNKVGVETPVNEEEIEKVRNNYNSATRTTSFANIVGGRRNDFSESSVRDSIISGWENSGKQLDAERENKIISNSIVQGNGNEVQISYESINSGRANKITNSSGSLNVGIQNTINNSIASINTGISNTIANADSSIFSGNRNTGGDIRYSIVSGTNSNIESAIYSTVAGTEHEIGNIVHSSVHGYKNNVDKARQSTISGGDNTVENIIATTIQGQNHNISNTNYSEVNGIVNTVSNSTGVSVEGADNKISNSTMSIFSGRNLKVKNVTYSTIFGNSNRINQEEEQSGSVINSLIHGSVNKIDTAIGSQVQNTFVIGYDNTVRANGNHIHSGAVIGARNTLENVDGFIIGKDSKVSVDNGVAIGDGANANREAGSTGWYYGEAPTTAPFTSTTAAIAVGDAEANKLAQIIGIAAGTEDTDAVNVAQLKQVATTIEADIDELSTTLNGRIDTVSSEVESAMAEAKIKTKVHSTDSRIQVVKDDNDANQYNLSLNDVAKQSDLDIVKTDLTELDGFANEINENVIEIADEVNKGVVFAADNSNKKYALGETVKIKGGKNVKTQVSAEGIEVGLADDVEVNSITAGGVKVSAQGVDMNNTKVTNLAQGEVSETSTDAVTGAQLHEVKQVVAHNEERISQLDKAVAHNGKRITQLNDKVDRNQKQARKGIAASAAIGMLPQPWISGKSMISAATTHHRGEQALAIGYSKLSDNGKHVFKLSGAGTVSGKKEGIVGAAYGFQW